MTLNIFWCAYWPFVNLLWRNVYSDAVPINKFIYPFCYWVVRVLYVSWMPVPYQIYSLQIFYLNMWVILFTFLWLNFHLFILLCFTDFFPLIIGLYYPTSLWFLVILLNSLCIRSFHSSLLEHELCPVLCDLWDCSTFHFTVVLSLHMQMSTQPKIERSSFAHVWDNLCSSTLFHILLCKLQQPWHLHTLDSVSSTERDYWVLFEFLLLACGLETISRESSGAMVELTFLLSGITTLWPGYS